MCTATKSIYIHRILVLLFLRQWWCKDSTSCRLENEHHDRPCAPPEHQLIHFHVASTQARPFPPYLSCRAPSRLDLEAAQTLRLPKSTADATSARCTEKATDCRCAHRARPLASQASVWTPTLFGLPLTVHRFDYLSLSILTYHFCVRLPLASPFALDPFVFRY